MEQWEKNYYISSIAGAANGSSLVVMSKGWLITCSLSPHRMRKNHDTSVGGVTLLCVKMTSFYALKVKPQVSNQCHFDVQGGVVITPTGPPHTRLLQRCHGW